MNMILGIPTPVVVIVTVVLTVLFGCIDRGLFVHLMTKTEVIQFKNRNFRHTWFYTFNFFMMYLPYINLLYFIWLICVIEIDNLTKYHIK